MRSCRAEVDGNVELWREMMMTTTKDFVGSHHGVSARCHWHCSPTTSSSTTSCRIGRSQHQTPATMTSDQTPPSPVASIQTHRHRHTDRDTCTHSHTL